MSSFSDYYYKNIDISEFDVSAFDRHNAHGAEGPGFENRVFECAVNALAFIKNAGGVVEICPEAVDQDKLADDTERRLNGGYRKCLSKFIC